MCRKSSFFLQEIRSINKLSWGLCGETGNWCLAEWMCCSKGHWELAGKCLHTHTLCCRDSQLDGQMTASCELRKLKKSIGDSWGLWGPPVNDLEPFLPTWWHWGQGLPFTSPCHNTQSSWREHQRENYTAKLSSCTRISLPKGIGLHCSGALCTINLCLYVWNEIANGTSVISAVYYMENHR